jgi:glycogen(starch) synthase
MRVLLVSQEVPPETGWGGIGTYVDVLSEALAAEGVEVHVLSAVEGQPESTREGGGVVVHRRPLPRAPRANRLPPESWRRIWLAANVARLVARLRLRPDIVECPEWGAEGLALALRRSLPLVVRMHSSARQLFPYTGQGRAWRGLDARLSGWLEEASARRAHAVISTRSNLEEVMWRLRLDESAVHAIPYPVRLASHPAPMPGGGVPRVTFVGRLEHRKGPDILLAAAPRVLAAVPNARFVFVGRDVVGVGERPSSRWLRREAGRLGIAGSIELTGHLGRRGVEEELRRATVCAFPSRWESFGNVVAEAATVGRPVVASAIPPFRELVVDGVSGRLCSLDDPNEWADALIEILTDPHRAGAMGKAGAARIAAISDPRRVARLTLEAYENAQRRCRHGDRARPRSRFGSQLQPRG